MKKITAVLLIALLLFAALLPAAFASTDSQTVPALDADGDGVVTIADAAAYLRAREPVKAFRVLWDIVFPPAPAVRHITQDEAAAMMARDDGHVIVDVRRQDEYDAGHIPGAVLVPNETIGTGQPDALPDLDAVLLIYCRSGVRARDAAQKLAAIGYSQVYEFGGILDWTGDIVTEEKAMQMMIDGTAVPVTWEDNASVAALKELLPLTVQMSMYGGFEQVGPLGGSLPRDDERTTTASGDIVLYSGDQIVIFYGSNTWAYTRLGRIELPEPEMEALLSNGDVTVTITG